MSNNKFQVNWQTNDGYAGGARPQSFKISADEIEDDMSDEDLSALYQEAVQSDFEQRVSASGENEAEFIEWAKEVLAERGK